MKIKMPTFELIPELKDGFSFSCQACGQCCKGFDTGEIFLFKKDVKRIFKHYDLRTSHEKEEFALTHFKIIEDSFKSKQKGTKKQLRKRFYTLGLKIIAHPNDRCIFLNDDDRCSIYPIRPFQCRSYPFWRIVLTDEEEFEAHRKECLALQKKEGRIYSPGKIITALKKEYRIEKQNFDRLKTKKFKIQEVYSFLKSDSF